jgi:hypothetical protein
VEVAILPSFARRESGSNSGTVLAIDLTMALAVLLDINFGFGCNEYVLSGKDFDLGVPFYLVGSSVQL